MSEPKSSAEVQQQPASSDHKEPPQSAMESFAEGKRLYIVGEFDRAADLLEKSCNEVEDHCGVESSHLAEPYFYYGKTLLELVKVEGDVFGDGAAVAEESDESEEDVGNSTCDDEGDSAPASKMARTSGPVGSSAGPSSAGSSSGAGAAGAASSSASNTEESSGRVISNLQLAWEVLEVARLITSRNESRESQIRLADIHISLAEAAMENSGFEEASKELEKAIVLRKKYLDADDRLIAEAHFQCGVALSFLQRYPEAISHTKASAAVFGALLERYQREGREASEIADLKLLRDDIEMKVNDIKDEMRNTAAIAKGTLEALVKSGSGPFAGSSGAGISSLPPGPNGEAIPVNNITSMVRKKKKTSTEPKENGDS